MSNLILSKRVSSFWTDYEMSGYQAADLVKVDLRVNGTDKLSFAFLVMTNADAFTLLDNQSGKYAIRYQD